MKTLNLICELPHRVYPISLSPRLLTTMNAQFSVLSTLAAIATSLSLALPVAAQPAVLTAREAASRINVRSAPTTQAHSPHYGLVGDRVETLRSTPGSDGYLWYYVQFNQSGATGWVRGDFIQLLNPPASSHTPPSAAWVARQRQLKQQFEQQFLGQHVNRVTTTLQHQGFPFIHDIGYSSGWIYFNTTDGSFEITLNYDTNNYLVRGVEVNRISTL